NTAQPNGDADLTADVTAPPDYRAIGFQRKAVIAPGADRRHARESHGNVQLTIAVIAPSHDCAVRFQGQAVSIASRNGSHTAEPGRDIQLTDAVGHPNPPPCHRTSARGCGFPLR